MIFRGNALTPDGLAQIDGALDQATSDSRVAPLLALPDPVIAPTSLIAAALGTDDFASLSQQQIDQAAAQLPIDRLIGADVDGTQVAIANVRLLKDIDGDGDTEDDEDILAAAELAIRDIAEASRGPLDGGSLSPAVVSEETSAATGSEMMLLMGLALAVIAALLGSALTTALGFGVLVFSSLTPFQQFGIVTAITIAYALIAAIVVVPPTMILWAAYQNYRLRSAVAQAERKLGDTP